MTWAFPFRALAYQDIWLAKSCGAPGTAVWQAGLLPGLRLRHQPVACDPIGAQPFHVPVARS